jgi:hypothetical protein
MDLLFHNESMQFLGQALLVIVSLFGRNADGLQGCAAFEGGRIAPIAIFEFPDACRKYNTFK